ncbi:LytR/AlgR family response regulator transcription factor [Gallaecimonas xiamenensis]|uniref:Response regulator receiver domain-containing protein n=1 Tax=Gallaecimonas xiamenensis 3-C-1 TaxID=745411 RepID=K2K6Q0_9GAMM|nr:LytTR family DNA-binding domain-containing protein [Gallaecimonas xiamenensis]EKE73080.1 response regulator receiver domain-containing protein [Gallaecimonas xiamenensis 3-C-1]
MGQRGFAAFERHRRLYLWLGIGLYLLVGNSINATSVWMEAGRHGPAQIALWEPFCWEYTSLVATLMVLPLLFFMARRHPPRLERLGALLLVHLAASLVFSLAHVGLMVAFRKGIYSLAGGHYDFGDWPRELLYEYRKDAWGYLCWYLAYQLFDAIYRRLKGEAALIADAAPEDRAADALPQHLLVRKLDKEYLVKVADIQWMEAAGNYVNLHSQGRIYPLRATLGKLLAQLAPAGFSRVHRSFAVNHKAIDHIRYQPSGDGEITLKGGQVLNLSRRYKDDFKASLGQA